MFAKNACSAVIFALRAPCQQLSPALVRSVSVAGMAVPLQEVFPMPPKSMLKINAAGSSVDVQSATGVDVASISATGITSGSSGVVAWRVKHARQDRATNVVELQELASNAPGSLTAIIPDKWISLSVSTNGSKVRVAKVTEADIDISTSGGSVELGTIRAINADIQTGGGALQGTELSATNIDVATGKGSLALKRLLAQQAVVATEGAPLSITALYGDDIKLLTGGSPIHIGTMDCSGQVKVASGGGGIKLDSLDGNAELLSEGGAVEVHLHSNVGDVHIASGGGDVSIAVSPETCVSVSLTSAASVEGDGDFAASGDLKVAHFKPSSDQAGTRGKEPRWGTVSGGSLTIDAGAGKVSVVRLGWADAVRAKLSKMQQQRA